MNEMVRQILVGVVIAAIAGVWVFASTRASVASVDDVRVDVKELEVELKEDIDKIIYKELEMLEERIEEMGYKLKLGKNAIDFLFNIDCFTCGIVQSLPYFVSR